MKKAVLFLFFSIYSLIVIGQKTEILEFEVKTHDFGHIPESGGNVNYTFKYTNISSNPVSIKDVKASCGCTTPKWSKNQIQPGEKGEIVAEYAPKYRPGAFNKNLTVSLDDNSKTTLFIKGYVDPDMEGVRKNYTYESEALLFKNEVVKVGNVKHDTIRDFILPIYNSLTVAIDIDSISLPPYMTLSQKYPIFLSQRSTNLSIKVDGTKVPEWGINAGDIEIKHSGGKISRAKIETRKVENFSSMSEEELKNAPVITFSKKQANFGDVRKGKTAKTSITFTNTGKSDLVIRKISPSCNCTTYKSKKNVIPPGKSGEIIVELNTSVADYNQHNIITIICNDPKSSENTLTIRANIIE